MEKELIFRTLGLEETSDEAEITRAYRTLLKDVNPEDHPEEFQTLRRAYEEALELCRQKELPEKEVPKDEVDLWIDEVEKVYQDITLRQNPKLWKELFANPVCDGLDTSLESREKLLVFLMSHDYLPQEIWKLIDQTFDIIADMETLSQKFPMNFLKFFSNSVRNEDFLPYEWFSYRNPESKQANPDAYINGYFTAREKVVNNEEPEGCLKALNDLEAFGLYHPYEDIERVRVFICQGEIEKSIALAQSILEKYPGNSYLMLYAGEADWAAGNKEKAYAIWNDILKQEPEHYTARYNVIRYLMDQKDYYQAHEMILELLDISEENTLISYLKTANEALIEEFREKLERGEEDPRYPGDELKLELVWCLFQNEQLNEAIKILESFQPQPESEYSYCNSYGRLLYQANRYEEALPYLQKWLNFLLELKDDGTPKTRKRLSRLSTAYFILGGCYYQLKNQQETEHMLLESIRTAKKPADRLRSMQYLANTMLWTKQYEKAIDLCDRILNEDEQYYPAYLIRQEASYELDMGQEVINDYLRAVEIVPNYYLPYLFAAQVLFHSGQYEDASRILERARENQAEFSPRTKLYQAKILRNLARTTEDRDKARKVLTDLKKDLDLEQCDIEDKSEVDYEFGLLAYDDNDYDQAISLLNLAISQNPDRFQYQIVCGDVYLNKGNYEEALKRYEAGEAVYSSMPWLYYNKACCYENMDQEEEAAANLKKALEIEDGYRDAYRKLADYYMKKYQAEYRIEDFKQAIDMINKQLSFTDSVYYRIHRGRLYLNAFELEKAAEDFKTAAKMDPENGWAVNNLGCCYQYLGEIDQAMDCFQRAVTIFEEHPETIPYDNLADCNEIKKEYAKSIEYFKLILDRFPDYGYIPYTWERIGNMHLYLNQYVEALEAYDKAKERDGYYHNIGDVCLARGEIEPGITFYEKAVENADEEDKTENLNSLGLLYLEDLRDYPKAINYFTEACAHTTDPEELYDSEKYIARAYYMMGNHEEAKKHAETALSHFKLSGQGTLENYLAYPPYRTARMGEYGWICLCLGQKEQALEYFSGMDQRLRCKNCEYEKCYESMLYLGYYYELEGNLEKAIEYYQKVLDRNPHDREACSAIKKLNEMKGSL